MLQDDGSFRFILAHQDPGFPNWIDTEGKLFGLVFSRFFMVEGEVETPRARVVTYSEPGN
jgi:hypothetical protein